MRRANEIVWEMSLDHELLETSRLRSTASVIRANYEVTGRWIDAIQRDYGAAAPSRWGMLGWDTIPKDRIADLLKQFQTHPLNHDFQADALADYLDGAEEPALDSWDVRIPSGNAAEVPLTSTLSIRPRIRTVVIKKETSSILVSGSSARVGSPEDEREGLAEHQVAEAKAEYEGRTMPGDAYRLRRPRPLLVVSVLWPVVRRHGSRNPKDADELPPEQRPLVGLTISFPRFDDSAVKGKVIYKVNEVYWRSLFEQEMGDDFGIDDEPD